MPSTVSSRAVPRYEQRLRGSGRAGGVDGQGDVGAGRQRAAFGAVVAVHTTIASPVQKNPHGTTRGKPSGPL